MEHMGAEMNVTFGVAENGVELRQGEVRTLIAPSEVMNLLQFTSLESCSETDYLAPIHVSLAFVVSMI